LNAAGHVDIGISLSPEHPEWLVFIFFPFFIISNLIYPHQDIQERVYCMQIHFKNFNGVMGVTYRLGEFPSSSHLWVEKKKTPYISHIMALMMPAL